MKNYNFRPIFQNFNENLVKNAFNFWRKFGKNLEVCISRGFGERSPPKLAILLKKSKKAMETSCFLEIFYKLPKKM